MADLTTERSFDSQATCVIDAFGLFFDLLSMGVCTARHWQTSADVRSTDAGTKCLYCSYKLNLKVALYAKYCILLYEYKIIQK